MMRYTGFFLVCIMFVNTLVAHHGISNFNHNKEVKITGVITAIDFVNPHTWLYIDVRDENGGITPWRCEMRSATVLKRSGWSKEMFRTGTLVTVTGSPERSDPNACYLGTIVFADGRSMDRYGQLGNATPPSVVKRSPRLPNGDPNIGGDWAAEQFVLSDPRGISGAFVPLSLAQKLKPGEVPEGTRASPGARGTPLSLQEGEISTPGKWPDPVPVTELGTRMAKEYDTSTVASRLLSCQPTNILYDWNFDFHVNRIIQQQDKIIIKYGFMDIERTIHMNMREHPADIEPSLAGHSIGRWEDDVLIVDTIGFTPRRLTRVSDVMYSEQFHVMERFTPDPDTNTITRAYVAEDPLYFKEPYKRTDKVYLSAQPYEEYNCDDKTRQTVVSKDEQQAKEDDSPWWKFWK